MMLLWTSVIKNDSQQFNVYEAVTYQRIAQNAWKAHPILPTRLNASTISFRPFHMRYKVSVKRQLASAAADVR